MPTYSSHDNWSSNEGVAEKDVRYNLSFYIQMLLGKKSFQVAAPRVNNTMMHLMDRKALWVMVTLCNGRVTLFKKIITVLEMKQSSAYFNELWWLLNIFMAKLILVKITLHCWQ